MGGFDHPSLNMIRMITQCKKQGPTVFNHVPGDIFEPLLHTRGNRALVAFIIGGFAVLAYQTLQVSSPCSIVMASVNIVQGISSKPIAIALFLGDEINTLVAAHASDDDIESSV